MPGGVNGQDAPALSSSPSLSLSPCANSIPGLPETWLFPGVLIDLDQDLSSWRKSKEGRLSSRASVQVLPSGAADLTHCCVTGDSPVQTECSARATSPCVCGAWAMGCVFKVPEVSVTCDILSHSFGCARGKQGRVE